VSHTAVEAEHCLVLDQRTSFVLVLVLVMALHQGLWEGYGYMPLDDLDLDANKQVVARFVEVCQNQHDLAAADAMFHPEFVNHYAPRGRLIPATARQAWLTVQSMRLIPHLPPAVQRRLFALQARRHRPGLGPARHERVRQP